MIEWRSLQLLGEFHSLLHQNLRINRRNWPQMSLDFPPMWFQEGRKCKPLSKGSSIFVSG